MSKPTPSQAARGVALRVMDHLLTIRDPLPHELTAAAWQLHGMERLLLAMGEDAPALAQVSDALSRLSNEPRDGYGQALARLRNDLEAAHG